MFLRLLTRNDYEPLSNLTEACRSFGKKDKRQICFPTVPSLETPHAVYRIAACTRIDGSEDFRSYSGVRSIAIIYNNASASSVCLSGRKLGPGRGEHSVPCLMSRGSLWYEFIHEVLHVQCGQVLILSTYTYFANIQPFRRAIQACKVNLFYTNRHNTDLQDNLLITRTTRTSLHQHVTASSKSSSTI
jgi:hypothetical protein